MNKTNIEERKIFSTLGINEDINHFIDVLIFRRKELGLSQRDLSLITGIKQSAIARIEKGKLKPRLDTILVLLRALDLKLETRRISTGWEEI